MLQKQSLNISFGQGLDTKTDPKQVLPGSLLTLENGIFQSGKRIKKRNGYASLGTSIIDIGGVGISNGVGLSTYNNELNLYDGATFYSYSEALNAWSDKGSLVTLNLNQIAINRDNNQQTTQDSAVHSSGIQVFTWEDSSGGSLYTVIDQSSGQKIVTGALLSVTGSTPKPFAFGNYIIILYYDSGTTSISYQYINVATPTDISGPIILTSYINSTYTFFDAEEVNNSLLVGFSNSTNVVTIQLFPNLIGGTFVTTAPLVNSTTDVASVCISVFGDASFNYWIAYYDGTSFYYYVVNSTNTTASSAFLLETIANGSRITGVGIDLGAGFIYEIRGSNEYDTYLKSAVANTGGGVILEGVFIRSVGLCSKVFEYNSDIYFLAGYGPPVTSSTTQSLEPTYFIISANTQEPIGKISPGTGGGVTVKSMLPEVNSLNVSGQFLVSYLQKDLLTSVDGNIFSQTGVNASLLDFTNDVQFETATLGNNLHATGGFVSMYDGTNIVEHGFHLYPEGVTGSTATSGGHIADSSSFEYQVTYEWTDNQGNIHRSAPSVGVIVVTGNSGSNVNLNTLVIPTLRLTSKQDVSIVVYRSTAGESSVFYRVSAVSPTNTGLTNNFYIVNDPTVDTVTFTDALADSSIVGNEQIYTTGGVIENIAAPATNIITNYQNRILLVPSEQPTSFWYSQEALPGDPVEFNDSFVQAIDPRGGNITALYQMDANLIVFKQDSIYYMTGEGPSPSGANNDFTNVLLVTADSGCMDQPSLVDTPMGIFYKSAKGFYLLERSLQATYVGAAVEAYNSYSVTSAQLIPTVNQVRFTLSNGQCLVYDYYYSQWSTWTNINANDSVIYDNLFYYITPTGVVNYETIGEFTDNGQQINLKLITGWFSLAQLQGFQRIYKLLILGDYISPHTLNVQIAYDFNPNFVQQDLIYTPNTDSNLSYGVGTPYGEDPYYGGGTWPTYEWRIFMARQKCTAFQVLIQDNQTTTPYGEGFDISNIACEIGVKQGLNKLPASVSYG